jgi:hypothetical protein
MKEELILNQPSFHPSSFILHPSSLILHPSPCPAYLSVLAWEMIGASVVSD